MTDGDHLQHELLLPPNRSAQRAWCAGGNRRVGTHGDSNSDGAEGSEGLITAGVASRVDKVECC